MLDCYSQYQSNNNKCKQCEYSNYCITAADAKPLNAKQYNDNIKSKTNNDATNTTQNQLPALTSADFIQALHSVMSVACNNVTRFNIMMSWISDYSCMHAKGRSGLITGIAQKLGLNQRTVSRHVQAISADPVLGKVFKYQNCRAGDRNIDKGSSTKPVRNTMTIQMELF